ncbi:hypothetical protein [Brevibacillus borstelensis]|uniref:hypothetical protein n=1 Tax=Brevibacillus borstelensis TaxID=45462 RepID=UPI0030BF603F
MEFYCPTCKHAFPNKDEICGHLQSFLQSLHGKKVWRVRFLHHYPYHFYSDEQINEMLREQPLTVTHVMCLEDFDGELCTGTDSLGNIVSIFD